MAIPEAMLAASAATPRPRVELWSEPGRTGAGEAARALAGRRRRHPHLRGALHARRAGQGRRPRHERHGVAGEPRRRTARPSCRSRRSSTPARARRSGWSAPTAGWRRGRSRSPTTAAGSARIAERPRRGRPGGRARRAQARGGRAGPPRRERGLSDARLQPLAPRRPPSGADALLHPDAGGARGCSPTSGSAGRRTRTSPSRWRSSRPPGPAPPRSRCATRSPTRSRRSCRSCRTSTRSRPTPPPGFMAATVTFRDDTPPERVPDLFYQTRKKLDDLRPSLPQGVLGPSVNDEYGDVYSVVYMLTADGLDLGAAQGHRRGHAPAAAAGARRQQGRPDRHPGRAHLRRVQPREARDPRRRPRARSSTAWRGRTR